MSLKDEFRQMLYEAEAFDQVDYEVVEEACQYLLPWLSQKLREAEAVGVERSAQVCDQHEKNQARHADVENYNSAVAAEQSRQDALAIRKLSPDPNFLVRKEAEARLAEAEWWNVGYELYRPIEARRNRIAKLQRQRAELSEEIKNANRQG